MANWGPELLAGIGIVAVCAIVVLVIKIFVSRRHRHRRHYLRHDRGNTSGCSATGCMNPSVRIAAAGGGFSWKDYPALMADAMDSGWPAFAFMAIDHPHRKSRAETSWEIGNGTELMQILSSNPGLADVSGDPQLFKSALPLPGPFLGKYSFPQEAYFEITLRNTNPSVSNPSTETVAVGLLGSSTASFGDHGSIGYFSNGEILLNGKPYTDERFKRIPWIPARGNTVGCGFNPALRTVFFTLNGDTTCQVDCSRSEEFGSPLHGGFVCNLNATAIVNLGQNSFEFRAENARRTPDPGNHRPYPSRMVEYDSGELFSQQLDSPAISQDLRRPAPSEAESELFEIVLDEKFASRHKP